ncbi:hypothetical protein Q7P37_002332 [Cladosporium fusiforme]
MAAVRPPTDPLDGQGLLTEGQIEDACHNIALLSIANPEANKWELKNSYQEELKGSNMYNSDAILTILWAKYLAQHVAVNGTEDNMPFHFEEIRTNPRSPLSPNPARNVKETSNGVVERMSRYFIYTNDGAARRTIRAVQERPTPSQQMVFFSRAFDITHHEAVAAYFGQGFMGILETWVELEWKHSPKAPNYSLARAEVDEASPLVNGDWRTSVQLLQEAEGAAQQEQPE